jgi:hypothetical protein
VGASHPQQVRANAAVADFKLGADEERRVESAFGDLALDPNAGVSLARRALSRCRWLAGALERRLSPRIACG